MLCEPGQIEMEIDKLSCEMTKIRIQIQIDLDNCD